MKKALLTIAVFMALLLVIPAVLSVAAFGLPAQFSATYYGQLQKMCARLNGTEGKKIVLIGNSAVAFGVDSKRLTEEMDGYTVVNFGLYGAVGTKAMLNLARGAVDSGDIVVVMPEVNRQSMSLYFSARNYWYCADGDFSLLGAVDKGDAGALAGSFAAFAAEKFSYFSSGSAPKTDGVYAQSSFNDESGNETGYMTYERAYNTMSGYYDPNNLATYALDLITQEFTDYLNDFYAHCVKRGASMYFGFVPLNRLALSETATPAQIDSYYDKLESDLLCPLLGNPHEYIMDWEWFYDNNVHTNSAGTAVYTRRLAEDLKAVLGDSSPTEIVLPEKPQPPPADIVDGDNADADCFTYEAGGSGVVVTGLTDKGLGKTRLVLPATVDAKAVTAFAAGVFAGNANVSEIVVPENVRVIYDGSFDGCMRLTRLTILSANPNSMMISSGLLTGAPSCNIYVPSAALGLYKTHYNWSVFAQRLFAS